MSGHDFSRAVELRERSGAIQRFQNDYTRARSLKVATRAAGGKAIFQTERMANLFIEVLRSQVRLRRFVIHEFVVMSNHVHLLLTLPGELSLEKAMQFVKGGFSFQAKRVLGFNGEVWQRGFSDVLVVDEESFQRHKEYTYMYPVRVGLANSPDEFRFSTAVLKKQIQPGARAPHSLEASGGTTEVVP